MSRLKKSLLRKQRKNESIFKYVLSLFHLWMGLLSSLVLFTVCFTGCLYAFKTQIENIVYKEYCYTSSNSKINVQAALDTFENRFGQATQVLIHPENNRSIEITSFSKQTRGVYAYFNPKTGSFLGKKNEGLSNFFHIVLDIHRWMMVEKPGKTIVGVFVLVFVYMLLSGIIMWIPKKQKDLRKSLSIKWKAKISRINYDLHKVLGFYSALLLLFIALTGLYVSFHWVKNITIQSLGGPSITINDENLGHSSLSKTISSSFNTLFEDLISAQELKKDALPLNKIIYNAQQQFVRKGRIRILFPFVEDGCFTFRSYGNTMFTMSIYDEFLVNKYGEVKRIEMFNQLPLYKQFLCIAKPLHTGEIFGLGSIILYFLASLIGCSLPITGFIIWWKKAAP